MAPSRETTAAVLLFVGSFLLYAGTIGYGYIHFDDTTILLQNPALYDERSLLASLRQIFSTGAPQPGRPMANGSSFRRHDRAV